MIQGNGFLLRTVHASDVDALYDACLAAGIPETHRGWPRLHAPKLEGSGLRIGALVDPDCSLLRLIGNP